MGQLPGGRERLGATLVGGHPGRGTPGVVRVEASQVEGEAAGIYRDNCENRAVWSCGVGVP